MAVPEDDPKQVVAGGYDEIAGEYVEWATHRVRDSTRPHYLNFLLQQLPPNAAVLDLGCGTGALVTEHLAHRFVVTGIDISPVQIATARRQVPSARFVCADMTELDFPPESFDAVAAFYSLNHLPRQELAPLLHAIARWLRPSGLFVAALPTRDDPGTVEPDWLGVPMFFSGFDAATNRQIMVDAGLAIVSARDHLIDEDGRPVTFHWVVARR